MGSLIIVLTFIAAYCSGKPIDRVLFQYRFCSYVFPTTLFIAETYCDTLPTTLVKPEDVGLVEKNNNSHAIEKGFFWKNPSRQRSLKLEEFRNLSSANNETSKRKSRLLDGLAFLAGLSVGGLAAAASSVKSVAKLPQGSFSLNLGSSKAPPYFAAYYNPYSLLPHPFFYPGSFGLVPINPAKPPTTSHNDLTQQVISIFENRPQTDLEENNKEYVDAEKKFSSDKSGEADDRTDLRAAADRNAEEKIVIRGCKEGQRKHGNFFKESVRAHEDFYSASNLDPSANVTANQTMTTNATMTSPPIQNTTYYPPPQYTAPSLPGYFGGYPQNINHVDLTTSSDAYRYQDPSHSNYNLPYERPHFYHDDKYNAYSNSHVNSYFSGPYSSDQTNEHAAADYNRLYRQPYQSPYDSFRPVK
nr:PREDICTED: uncharacterized protein LOC105677301 [Linepithema humile]